jgi:hypothetical protein
LHERGTGLEAESEAPDSPDSVNSLPPAFAIEDAYLDFDPQLDAELDEPISLFERAPLALRDADDESRVAALRGWLSRVRARQLEDLSEYRAG